MRAARAVTRDRRVDVRIVQREQLAHPLGRARAVERGGERKPTTGRVAERRCFTECVDRWLVSVGERGTRRPEAHGHRTLGHNVAADRGDHVVAAAGAHRDACIETERLGGLAA